MDSDRQNLSGVVIDDQIEILEPVGSGGMGTVFRAHHRAWNQYLAVKSPHAGFFSEAGDKERFLLEAQTWIDLGIHPNIVTCWFIYPRNGLPLLFLDLLEGGSLRDEMVRGRVLPGNWSQITSIGIQVCDGLQHAHNLGLVHRDIKPANLLLDKDGRICVTDFGLVKNTQTADGESIQQTVKMDGSQFSSDLSLTQTGSVVGTPHYASPEQWNQDVITPKVDIYSLGVLLYELCSGSLPFDHGSEANAISRLYMSHVYEAPKPVQERQPTIPPELDRLILQCLAKDPKQRPSAGELRVALAEVYLQLTQTVYHELAEPVQQRADSLNNKAFSLWHLGIHKKAISCWDEALTFDAAHPESIYNRGRVLWQLGQLEGEELAAKLQELKKVNAKGSAFLGLFHLARAKPFEAEMELASALERSQELQRESQLWAALGDCRMQLERYESASDAYSKSLQLSSQDLEVQRRLRWASSASKPPELDCYFPRSRPIWENSTEKPIVSLFGSNALSEDSGFVLCQQQDQVECWDISRNESSWRASIPVAQTICCDEKLKFWTVLMQNGFGLIDLVSGRSILQLAVNEKFLGYLPSKHCGMLGNTEMRLARFSRKSDGQLEVLRSQVFSGHDKQVSQVKFSDCGCYLVSGSYDRSVRVWEVASGLPLYVISRHKDFVESVAFSSKRRYVASGGRDGVVWVCDGKSGQALLELRPPVAEGSKAASIYRLQFCIAASEEEDAATCHYLLSWQRGGANGICHLWDCRDGRLVRQFDGRCMLSNGGWIAHGSSAEADNSQPTSVCNLFNLRTLSVSRSLTIPGIYRCAWEDEGSRHLVIGSEKGGQTFITIRESSENTRIQPTNLWLSRAGSQGDLKAVKQAFNVHIKRGEDCFLGGDYAQAWSELERARALPGYERAPEALSLVSRLLAKLHKVKLLSIHESKRFKDPNLTNEKLLDLCVLSSQPLRVATASANTLRIWNAESGACVQSLTGHAHKITHFCHTATRDFDSARSHPLISLAVNGSIRVWDLRQGECCRYFKLVPQPLGGVFAESQIKRFAWNVQKDWALLLTEKEELYLLNCEQQQPVTLKMLTGIVDFKVGQDWSTVLLQKNSAGLEVYDALRQVTLDRSLGSLLTGASKDSKFALTALGPSQTQPFCLLAAQETTGTEVKARLTLVHIKERRLLREFSLGLLVRDSVCLLQWTQDSMYFACVHQSGRITIWSLYEPEAPLWDLTGPWGRVTHCAFDADVRHLVTLGTDQVVRVWELDWSLSATLKQVPPGELFVEKKKGFLSRLFGRK
jgi:serine/threonine protein kinase